MGFQQKKKSGKQLMALVMRHEVGVLLELLIPRFGFVHLIHSGLN
jgi:hypothetical protein